MAVLFEHHHPVQVLRIDRGAAFRVEEGVRIRAIRRLVEMRPG
jgi:hypothetical protein